VFATTPAPRGFAALVAISPRLLELEAHAVVGQAHEALAGEWRAQNVAQEACVGVLVQGAGAGLCV